MKRSILCSSCEPIRPGVKHDDDPLDVALRHYQKERAVIRQGNSLRSKSCDCCGRAIDRGEECFTESILIHEEPYDDWHRDYIE